MPDLEPITREEMLLDGQDLEPITRKEMFIKRIYDKTQVVPEPITREEMFLKKAGDETTDVTIERLNVSANGTYSESGKAYSPVIVNVPAPPIPDNAYLLNEVEGLPSDIATFTDGSNLPMPALKVGIEPQQDLHGYDSPWVGGAGKNKLNLEFSNDTSSFSNLTFSHTDSTFKLKGTVSEQSYKIFNLTLPPNVDLSTDYTLSATVTGTVDSCLVGVYFKNGNTDVENIRVNIADTTPQNTKQVSAQFDNALFIIEGLQSGSYFDCEVKIQLEKGGSATTFQPYSNICPISGWDEANVVVSPTTDAEDGQTYNIQFTDGDNPLTVYGGTLDVVSGELKVVPYYASYNGETLEGEWISDRDVYAVGTTPTIGAQVVNIGATPQTYQLTPTQVKSLLGSNNVWCDTGKIEELEYFSKEV